MPPQAPAAAEYDLCGAVDVAAVRLLDMCDIRRAMLAIEQGGHPLAGPREQSAVGKERPQRTQAPNDCMRARFQNTGMSDERPQSGSPRQDADIIT